MGNVAYYGEDTDFKNIRINSNMVILRTKDKLLTQFLYYFLQSNYFKKQIIPYKYIALPVASLPMSLLKNIEFYFPSLIQQKVIVNFISQFDKKINLYKKINKNLEEQLKTIFNSFFLYYDNFSKENLKESEIGLIPNQWNLLSLGEITTEIKEKVGNNTYEIFSGMDALRLQGGKGAVPGGLAFQDHRTVGVIPFRPFPGPKDADFRRQTGEVALEGSPAQSYLFGEMAQVAQTHSGLQFVQFGITSRGLAMLGVADAEIGQILQRLPETLIGITDSTALDGGKHLGGMEAQDGGVAVTDQGDAFVAHAESVGRIIDYR